MQSELLDEIGDTLFAAVVAAAIGLGAANLAIQVNKEQAAFDAGTGSPKLSHIVPPPPSPDVPITDLDKTGPTGLNF
jgi:hypothetical protein